MIPTNAFPFQFYSVNIGYMDRILKDFDKKISYKGLYVNGHCNLCKKKTHIKVFNEAIEKDKVKLTGKCKLCKTTVNTHVADFIKPVILEDNQGVIIRIPYI